jgi:peptidoglycan lytic transglycosylase D
MKRALRLFLAVLPAMYLVAGVPFLSLNGSTASAAPLQLRLTGEAKDRLSQVAALSLESNLSQALEIPPSETFTMDDAGRVNGDFELKLPEESLPDSDIPLTLNSKVEYFINYFQTSARDVFARWLSRSERYVPMMKQVLKKEQLPEELIYLAMIESGFSPHAYSSASAVGPWQFMSATGKRYSLRIDQWIDERRDPLKSTVAAAMYLKELYGMFNKDWYLAAAGYNAGENKILRAIDMYNSRDFWQLSKGSFLKRETKEYVPKLLAAAIIAKDPAKYGFSDVAYLAPIELDTVIIPSSTDLELVAKICGVSNQSIRDLNPELRRWCTPPDYPNYELKIPKGMKATFEAQYAKIPEPLRYTEKVLYTRYRVGKRETLASVAKRFGTTTGVIAELNHLGRKSRIKGKTLTVPTKSSPSETWTEVALSDTGKAGADGKELNKYYTVKKGDTLHSLASKFNISAKFLTAWNNLKGKLALRPGARIIVAKFVEKQGTMAPVGDQNG